MSDHDSVHFPQLNDTNYAKWAMCMEVVFVKKDLWSVVNVKVNTKGKDNDEAEKKLEIKMKKQSTSKMAEAQAEMILCVKDGQLSHMHEHDLMEIWQMLQRVHRAANFVTSLALCQKFLTMKKSSSQSMQAWIRAVKALAFCMEAAGIDVSKQDTILALTIGLPNAYDAIIINFDTTPTEQLTLDHVIGHLLNEETHQKSSAGNVKPKKEEPGDEAVAVIGGRHTRGGGNDTTYFFCDKSGHFKPECLEKKEWERSRNEKEKESSETVAVVYLDSSSDEASLHGFI